jgi:virginiamycin B lyase
MATERQVTGLARRCGCWATVVVLMLLPLLAACGDSGDDGSAKPVETAAVAETPAPVTETNVENAGAEKIFIKGDWLAAGEGGVWLSGDSELYRLDPRSGRKKATIRVPQGPCEASDVGFGTVGTATCKVPGLARIDPRTDRVTGHVKLPIPELDGEGSIGAGQGGVWLATDGPGCSGCRIARVDPRTMKVTGKVAVQAGAATVRTGQGAVWVANPEKDLVEHIDPKTEKVIRTVKTGPGPRFFGVGEGAVWTLNQGDGSVTRIDPTTGKATNVDAGVPGEGGDLTVGGGSVWARGSDKLLARIDPKRNQVVEPDGPSSGSGAVIVGAGAVWISAHDVDTVWRLPLSAH